jgi:signal transduction histidine kinase
MQAGFDRALDPGVAERRVLAGEVDAAFRLDDQFVQQRLLALSYQITLAIDDAVGAGDDALPRTLDEAAGHVEQAFAELRDLAHGLYPVVLTEAGLGPALDTLADTTPLSISVSGLPDHRLPESVEGASYLMVVGCVQAAHQREATRLHVRFDAVDDRVEIDIDDDGSHHALGELANVGDRLSALGGSVRIETNLIHAVIPCG